MNILHGSNQYILGHVSPECTAGGGLLQGICAQYCDGKPLPWGLHGFKVGAGSLDGGESGRLTGIIGHLFWGGASAPADRIHSPEEVPPAGVVLRATLHPGHRDGLPSGRG